MSDMISLQRTRAWPWVLFALLAFAPARANGAPKVPLRSGTYVFRHRDEEFPASLGFEVKVVIRGDVITVINPREHGPMPAGVLDGGTLFWHPRSRVWIITSTKADRSDQLIGPCGGGPSVVDFKARIIWTCEAGP